MEIVQLGPDQYAETAQMLSRAFRDDPMWSFLEPDPAARPWKNAWVVERWQRLVAPLGASWVAVEKQSVIGAGLWFPPEKFEVSLGRMLAAGFWRMPLALGLRWTVRSWGILSEGVQHQESLMKEPYWVLDVLGVDPSRQKTGVGRALVEVGLQLADKQRIPSFVVTHKKTNVTFYERFGFVLMDEWPVNEGGPVAYSLRRPVPSSC